MALPILSILNNLMAIPQATWVLLGLILFIVRKTLEGEFGYFEYAEIDQKA